MVHLPNFPKHRILLKSQYTVAASMMLSPLTAGVFIGWMTIGVPILRAKDSPIPVTDTQLSWIISIPCLGVLLSAIPAGILRDKYRCRNTLIISTILPITSWVLIHLSTYFRHWEILLIAQMLNGLTSGVAATIIPLYLGEIAEPQIRGLMITMIEVFLRLGTFYAFTISFFIPFKDLPWINGVLLISFITLLTMIPESPQYYIKNGNMTSARESLRCLRHNKSDDDIENELKEMEISVKKQMENSGKFSDLLDTKGNRKALFIVVTLTILQKLSGPSVVISYLPIILPTSMQLPPMILIIVIETLRFLSGLISSLIYDKVGPRIILLITSVTCCFTMFVTGLWYYVHSHIDITSGVVHHLLDHAWIPFVGILFHGMGYALGLQPVCDNIKNEYFPINVKGRCSALTNTLQALAAFINNKTFLEIGQLYGYHINFWIYAIANVLVVIITQCYVIETKGRTLQDIQDELNKKKPKPDVHL